MMAVRGTCVLSLGFRVSESLRCALPLACLSRLGELEGAPSTESDAKLRRYDGAAKKV